MGKLMKRIKYSSYLGRRIYWKMVQAYTFCKNRLRTDKYLVKKKYYNTFGFYPNLEHPKRLTEYLQWLKLNDRKALYATLVDKYAVRDIIKLLFGEEYLIPLVYQTSKAQDISEENIKHFPCIVKCNHDSGYYQIIRAPKECDWKALQIDVRAWLSRDYYYGSQEWPYKNIPTKRVVVEQLLETKDGKIPNDYKLHYINGELQFVYVSYDREGSNDRCTYDENWNKLPFVWVPKASYKADMNTTDVPCPKSFEQMKKFGQQIASLFDYVRVDFYDVDGKLYFGEITLYHGSGMDVFFPDKYDEIYGAKLIQGMH